MERLHISSRWSDEWRKSMYFRYALMIADFNLRETSTWRRRASTRWTRVNVSYYVRFWIVMSHTFWSRYQETFFVIVVNLIYLIILTHIFIEIPNIISLYKKKTWNVYLYMILYSRIVFFIDRSYLQFKKKRNYIFSTDDHDHYHFKFETWI